MVLGLEDFMTIQALVKRGVYVCDIAQQLGVHPKTVRRALQRGGPPTPRRGRRGSRLDPYRAVIDALVAEGVWNAVVIWRELQARGYPGGVSIIRDYVRPKRALRPSRATVRFETEPGRQLQTDWAVQRTVIAGAPVDVHFAVSTLGYSRRFHFWATRPLPRRAHFERRLLRRHLASFRWFNSFLAARALVEVLEERLVGKAMMRDVAQREARGDSPGLRLGVGGLALALAAQPTIENLIAALTLYADRPVRVGEFCRFGDTLGTVEEIGMWSTRIRTLDQTVLSVANADFSKGRLENYTARGKIWYHPRIRLRYETTPDQVRYILVEVRKLLYAHPRVLPDPARIRFVGFGEYSLDLAVFAYIDTKDYGEHLEITEDLNLRIMDVIKAAGTELAIPARLEYQMDKAPLDEKEIRRAEASVQEWRGQRTM
jgi:hypothetical protein